MTPSQQAALEQVAREYIQCLPFTGTLGEYDNAVRKLVTLLAAQRAAVLEEAAKRLEQEAEDWDKAISGTFKEAARIIRQQAQEQRP